MLVEITKDSKYNRHTQGGIVKLTWIEVDAVGVELLGTVTHYFGKLSVAVLDLKGPLMVKDLVAFKGANTDFEQEIESMQVDHQNIEAAVKGQEVAVKVKGKVRVGDSLYKLT